MSNRINRLIASEFFPSYIGQEPAPYHQALDAHAERLRRRGVTHVMVNQGLVNIPRAMYPDNPYFEFCSYGHSLDKYVTSSYNEGIYYEDLLAENRRLLLHNAALARKYGVRCAIRCVEPTFMIEPFFQRHPALRGPRVDNPACSTQPVYALCPMLAETQDHYRQMIRKVLALVPEIDEMHIFTNDSGGGVCYSGHLYAGSNGPGHCRKTPTAKQAQEFCRVIAEAGREINPDFRVVMTSGLSPQEKKEFLDGLPPGVASSVYGAFAWGGGLEDRWANQAVGPAIYGNSEERRKAREWQHGDYGARVRQLTKRGIEVYANYNTDYYTGDDPRPYETHEVICQLLAWGVANIIGGAPGTSEFSANTAVFRDAVENGTRPTAEVVAEVARRWVGDEFAPSLCEAWRLNDHAGRELPVPNAGHLLQVWTLIRRLPIVPDESKLSEGDIEYFRHEMATYDQKMRDQHGGVWRILHYGQDLTLAYLRQYDTVTFPSLERAIGILDGLLARPGLSDAQRRCIGIQRNDIEAVLLEHRHYSHWMLASLHRIAGVTAPAGFPSLAEVIRREIELCRTIDRKAGHDPAGNPRIRLMEAHVQDPAQRVDLSAFPRSVHQGCDHWEAATDD